MEERLRKAGWDEVALAGISDLNWEEIKRLLGPVTGTLSFSDELTLRVWVTGSEGRQRLDNTTFARRPVAFFTDSYWARRYGPEAETPLLPLMEWDRVKALAPVARWPSRFHRALDRAPDGGDREAMEAKERERVVTRLADVLARCGLWNPERGEAGRPGTQLAQHRFAMGRRLGTLRQHVRNIEKMNRFCLGSFGSGWFSGPRDFYDLVAGRLAEPCGRHVPRALLTSIGFAEQAAEVPEDRRLSRDAGVRNFLKEVETAGGWRTGKVAKKASPFPLLLALSLEDFVIREEESSYPRWMAWVKLLKIWAAFRWDDLQGIPNHTLVMRVDGVLEGKLMRTKTSGVGKKVEVQHFFIGPDAYFLHQKWLLTGWTLNTWMSSQAGMERRDYLVPLPTPRLDGFRRSMMKYSDAMSASRALMAKLRVDIKATEDDQDCGLPSPWLVLQESVGFWSEHSERGTMDTWMLMAKVPPEIRKKVGRWSVTQEEEYLRNLEAGVRKAQEMVGNLIRRGPDGNRDLQLFEVQVLSDLSKYLEDRGVSSEKIKRQVDLLSMPVEVPVGGGSPSGAAGSPAASVPYSLSVADVAYSASVFGVKTELASEPSAGGEAALLSSGESEGEAEPAISGMDVALGSFVFSLRGTCNRRTLHRVGECWRKPGVHYRDFLVAGSDRPPLEAGDHECRDCFKQNRAVSHASESSGEELTSSSSSEDGEGPVVNAADIP